jgi:hypothetical protein
MTILPLIFKIEEFADAKRRKNLCPYIEAVIIFAISKRLRLTMHNSLDDTKI